MSLHKTNLMLGELQKLESMSEEYSYELEYLSKRIRSDLWNINKNSLELFKIMKAINNSYYILGQCVPLEDFIDLSAIINYIYCLRKYSLFYLEKTTNCNEYFDGLASAVQLVGAKKIIEEQWDDINKSEEGYMSFLNIFDEIFTNCIDKYYDEFFIKMESNDELCRVVSGVDHDYNRFIPWPSKTNNRWNPPGKQFLYLSYAKEKKMFNSYLTMNEYICLKEYRANKDESYSFCDFRMNSEGKILDLSYNDISVQMIKSNITKYKDNIVSKIVNEMISNPKKENYRNRKILKADIRKKLSRYKEMNNRVIEESYAKQYLKMICSCIYTKVDEVDEESREKAYRSFHILSSYLESKGVTGIIYPCTRTKKIIGKNIVLFNVDDAHPIKNSIREIVYR